MIARIVLALVAVWLVLSIANVHHQRNALGKFATRPAAARPDARAASTLNPDRYPRILEAASYLLAGDRTRGAALLERFVRDEPDNVRAWALLYQANRSPRAAVAIKRLSPLR